MTIRPLRHALDDPRLPVRAFGSEGTGGGTDETTPPTGLKTGTDRLRNGR